MEAHLYHKMTKNKNAIKILYEILIWTVTWGGKSKLSKLENILNKM